MRKILIECWIFIAVLITACGDSRKEKQGDLNDKKANLEKLKKDQKNLSDEIAVLEKDIAAIDTSAAKQEKAKLVTLTTINPGSFFHYIDLQGKIEAENIAYVSPRGGPGQVRAIYVKQGQYVKKGQLLLKLDDAVMLQNLSQLETQLAFAKNIYQRQKNLWDQGIGTEVQFITAKNNVDAVERQIGTLKETWQLSFVRAEISGVADEVNVKVGEIFGNGPQIRIVNTNSLKVVTQVPENYLGRVGVGSNILIALPEANRDTIRAKVNVSGKIIDPNNRSFYIEAKIPAAKNLRPNQLAFVKIQDYTSANAITIPVNTLQNDEKGKFVLIAEKEGNKMVARKRQVIIGELYGDRLEVKSGLQSGDVLVTEGFQSLYEGQLITTDVK